MKNLLVLFFALFTFTASSMAFNKEAFPVHLRKALGLDTRAEIKVLTDPVASNVGNLSVISITLGGAPYQVYFTPDEKKYIWGMVVDYTVDPDKARANEISLKKVRAKGSPNAPVTIVEYSDYQCNYCKNAHDILTKELYKFYKPDQVRFVFKHFPLSNHDWAERAAVAAECAGQQKEATFWGISDYFFANQNQINKDNVNEKIQEAAKTLDLNYSTLQTCMSQGAMLEKVRADRAEGGKIGVASTPTIVINGRSRRGLRDFEDVKVVVEEKLQELRK